MGTTAGSNKVQSGSPVFNHILEQLGSYTKVELILIFGSFTEFIANTMVIPLLFLHELDHVSW